jgi:hypothetical protein
MDRELRLAGHVARGVAKADLGILMERATL